jgi:hypothetical protein
MIKYKNQYAIEAWYESIKEHTYKTEFLELSQDECRAIVNWYNDHIRAAKLKKEIVDNENDKKILEKLKERIEDKIQVLEAKDGFFFKLSTRSPKDSIMASNKLRDIMAEQLKSHPPKDENAKVVLYLDCMIRAFRVQTAEEVLEFLIKSERVYTDLDRWLAYPDKLAPINLIFREYDDNIMSHMEFRGFVYKKKLTAVSQYYDTVYFDFLVKNRDQIQQRIQHYFETTICPLIAMENYVIDFVVYDDLSNDQNKVIVIELNPWAKTTGASMFSWYEHSDVKILNGEAPFELRVRTEPIPNVLKELFPDIQQLITEAEEKSGVNSRHSKNNNTKEREHKKKDKKDCSIM